MPTFEEAFPPRAPYEDPRADKYDRNLREQLEQWNAELGEIERKIAETNAEDVARLDSIAGGLEAARSVHEHMPGAEDANEKNIAYGESLRTLMQQKMAGKIDGIEELLARRRQLKQLIQGAAIDAANRPSGETA